MDPNSPVIRLCVAGMQAEMESRLDRARELFLQAWQERKDDYEACLAAHYVARHQKTAEEILHWNQTSLHHADAVNDERVYGFYPSLYLNMGKAHEDLGNRKEAIKYYELAATKLSHLPEGRYGELVRDGIARGVQRAS